MDKTVHNIIENLGLHEDKTVHNKIGNLCLVDG